MIVNNLPQYVEEHRLPILRNAVIGNRSAKEFNLQTGVKGATALNLLVTDVTFGDGSACGWNEAGTSTLSQRILTPGAIKVNMSFCDKTLLKTWANYDVRVAAGQKTLPFDESIPAEKLFIHLLQIIQIIGCLLIHIIIQPIGIQYRCIASPSQIRQCTGIISREIIIRHLGIQSLVPVTVIFII